MSCYNTPCTCVNPCAPAPCNDGCLYDVSTKCVQLENDLTVCTDTLTKGTTLTDVLSDFADKLCGNITVTVLDIKSKVSASDTTTDYLNNKLVGASNSISKTILNAGGNEQLSFAVKVSPTGSSNQIQVLSDGLYVPPASATAATTLAAVDSNSIDTTVTSVVGGYTVKGDVRIDSVTGGNILTVGSNGLYVPPYTPSPSLAVAPNDTASFDSIVTLVGSTYNVGGNVKIDPSSTAPVSITSQGLKIDCCTTGNTVITTTDTQSIDYTLTPITGGFNITSSVIISPTAGNALQQNANGLYVPTPSLTFSATDTNTLDLTWSSNVLTADLKYQDSNSIDLSVPNSSGLKADVKISATAGNGLQILGDGLYSSINISGTCQPLTGSDISFALKQDKEGQVFLMVTPSTLISYDSVRLSISYTKTGGSAFNHDFSYIVPMKFSGLASLSEVLLPDFDLNNSQTVTIDARRQCSALNTTSSSTSYTTTVSYTAPSYDLETWTNIPSGWLLAGCVAGSVTPQYKISRDGKEVFFRGSVTITITGSFANNSITSGNVNWLDLDPLNNVIMSTFTNLYYMNQTYHTSCLASGDISANYDRRYCFQFSGDRINLNHSYKNTSGGTITSIVYTDLLLSSIILK